MRKFSFAMLAVALVLAFVSCGEIEGGGLFGPGGLLPGGNTPSGAEGLTITDIPSRYNGYYIYLNVEVIGRQRDYQVIGCDKIDVNVTYSTLSFTCSRITNGTARVPLWSITGMGYNIPRFTGSGTISYYEGGSTAFIMNTQDLSEANFDSTAVAAIMFTNPVTITYGKGTVSVNNSQLYAP